MGIDTLWHSAIIADIVVMLIAFAMAFVTDISKHTEFYMHGGRDPDHGRFYVGMALLLCAKIMHSMTSAYVFSAAAQHVRSGKMLVQEGTILATIAFSFVTIIMTTIALCMWPFAQTDGAGSAFMIFGTVTALCAIANLLIPVYWAYYVPFWRCSQKEE